MYIYIYIYIKKCTYIFFNYLFVKKNFFDWQRSATISQVLRDQNKNINHFLIFLSDCLLLDYV